MVVATVAELRKEFGLDSRRIYLGGFSMGGCGTWELLTRYPHLFAAAFPIAGKGEATGEYTVTGMIELSDYAWLSVEQIATKK